MPRVSAGLVPLDGPWIGTRLKQAAEVIADRARANSAWSERIPASVRVYASGTPSRQTIAAGGVRAPMAFTFEAPGGRPVWHPVWGHGPRETWHWVAQTPRPFLSAAGDEAADEAADVFARAIDDWAIASGFK